MNPKLETYLAEQQKLCDEATEGPWTTGDWTKSVLFGPNEDGSGIAFDNPDDAPFIASTRTEHPRILQMLKVALEALERSAVAFEHVHKGSTNSVHHDALTNITTLIP